MLAPLQPALLSEFHAEFVVWQPPRYNSVESCPGFEGALCSTLRDHEINRLFQAQEQRGSQAKSPGGLHGRTGNSWMNSKAKRKLTEDGSTDRSSGIYTDRDSLSSQGSL